MKSLLFRCFKASFLLFALALQIHLGSSPEAAALSPDQGARDPSMCIEEIINDESLADFILSDAGLLDGVLDGYLYENATLEFPPECPIYEDQDPQPKPKPIEVTLIRTCCGTQCVFGELYLGDELICKTLELPWNNNERNKSCIPTGEYACKRIKSPKFGWTYEITEVKGRSHILFHAGNWPKNTSGCVLLGEKILVDKNMITNSRVSVKKFMDALNSCKSFKLTIKDKTKEKNGEEEGGKEEEEGEGDKEDDDVRFSSH